jgi:hypothetical protein
MFDRYSGVTAVAVWLWGSWARRRRSRLHKYVQAASNGNIPPAGLVRCAR